MEDNYTPQKHVCGVCMDEWLTEAEYNTHSCNTGFTPIDPLHHGPEFLDIQKAALERAKERPEVENDKQDVAIAEVEAAIDNLSSTDPVTLN